MSVKLILTPVISIEEDQAALVAAAEIAEKFHARPTALILAVHLSSTYGEKEAPLSEVLQDLTGGASSHAAQLRSGLTAWLTRAPYPFEVRDLAVEHAVNDDKILAHARFADLVIVARAATHDRARQALIEDVLFKSGRPLLIVPERPLLKRNWDKIVIGWNAKPEAVRAIIGAGPFLDGAKRVIVATVDAKAVEGAPPPGQDLAAYLNAHGIDADVHNVDSQGRSDAKALLDDAIAVDADMLVLGAYGHSRAREILFGGVTREMIAGSPIPLLMAH